MVLLQHGFMDSADIWVLRDDVESSLTGKAPAYSLVDLDHDVWLGNNRGNKYSLEHKTLTPNDKSFWDFSFEEMGDYDMPA